MQKVCHDYPVQQRDTSSKQRPTQKVFNKQTAATNQVSCQAPRKRPLAEFFTPTHSSQWAQLCTASMKRCSRRHSRGPMVHPPKWSTSKAVHCQGITTLQLSDGNNAPCRNPLSCGLGLCGACTLFSRAMAETDSVQEQKTTEEYATIHLPDNRTIKLPFLRVCAGFYEAL